MKAKGLNDIISKYVPSEFSVKSSNMFLDLLRNLQPTGLMASLDVTSLLTNVPVDETISIIIEHVYNHPTIPSPKIHQNHLKSLLDLCTKETPFKDHNGQLFYQKDGVAMGSPLGPTFACFYMGNLEKRVLNNHNDPPIKYLRYIDDIFIIVRDENHLNKIKEDMERQSVLNFTYELNIQGRLPFLDILVEESHQEYKTKVYRKPTDFGAIINYDSQCPDRYKISAIRSYLIRAHRFCTSNYELKNEINNIKQILVNNGFPNWLIENEILKFNNRLDNSDNINKIKIYYESQMHCNYKIDEDILKNIVRRYTRTIEPNNKINLIIYYKNKKTSSMIMRNSPYQDNMLKSTNVVYQFQCKTEGCTLQNNKYIGMTSTNLSRRITMHLQMGGIKDHFINTHPKIPRERRRALIVENMSILAKCKTSKELEITEAIFIKDLQPNLNIQSTRMGGVLKLFPPIIV